jgi:rhodanese-related sulfurtransferase
MSQELDVRDLKRRLDDGERPLVLDVREAEEIAIARFPGAVEIPMHEVPGRLGELDTQREIVVVCHHGVRSAHIAAYLAGQGFERVSSLSGGIDAWSLLVDSSVPRY